MHAKFKKPLDVMAVITDKEARTTEVMDVDCIYLEQLQIFLDRSVANITLRIGSCDSKGKFHPSHEYDDKIARMNIVNPIFTELFLDDSGNFKNEITKEDFTKIYSVGIPGANQLVWGFDDVEVTLEDSDKSIVDKAQTLLKIVKPVKP